MIRRSLTLMSVIVASSLAVAACGGSTASPAPGTTPAPGAATPAPGGATPAPVGPAGSECANIPTFDPQSLATPVLPVDATLMAKYPTTIAGQPITDAEAIPLVAFMCELGGQSSLASLTAESTVLGVDFSTAVYGSFSATINSDTITVTAIRFPNQDASQFMSKVGQFGGLFGAASIGAITTQSLGGKNVSVSTQSGATSSTYLYTTGDTLFIIDNATSDEAATVLAALP